MTIEEYFGDWSKVIDLKEADKIVKRLASSDRMFCPQMKDIFKAFRLCSLSNLRVVILGQDPYPQRNVATGIAFANSPDTPEKSYSPSLNILMESVIDFTVPHRRIIFDPSLEKWEAQGVLMLNSALTCELGKPGSHALLWRPFINSFLSKLSMQYTAVVYMLMGSQAQSFESSIAKNNYVIKTRHPSYYARTVTRMPSDIWKQVNDILININGFGIQWYEES